MIQTHFYHPPTTAKKQARTAARRREERTRGMRYDRWMAWVDYTGIHQHEVEEISPFSFTHDLLIFLFTPKDSRRYLGVVFSFFLCSQFISQVFRSGQQQLLPPRHGIESQERRKDRQGQWMTGLQAGLGIQEGQILGI